MLFARVTLRAVLFALSLASCADGAAPAADTETSALAPIAPRPRALPWNALAMPLMRQSTNYSCGTAAVQSVLTYFRKADQTELFDGYAFATFYPREDDLRERMHTTYDSGTPPQNIVKFLGGFTRESGPPASLTVDGVQPGDGTTQTTNGDQVTLRFAPATGTPIFDVSFRYRRHQAGVAPSAATNAADLAALRAALAAGDAVIVDLQAWTSDPKTVDWQNDWSDGHYVVLVGMDAANVFVMDPSSAAGYAWLPIPELLQRWHDADMSVEYQHGAIFVRGANGLRRFPAPLVKMD